MKTWGLYSVSDVQYGLCLKMDSNSSCTSLGFHKRNLSPDLAAMCTASKPDFDSFRNMDGDKPGKDNSFVFHTSHRAVTDPVSCLCALLRGHSTQVS